ncbi:MAG: septal ring lytic transglycosylase RlpA family protein [Betaproteobacteria bacterium]
MSRLSPGQSALGCRRAAVIAVWASLVVGCAPPLQREPPAPAVPAPRPGAYYQDDGPGANPPDNLDAIADAAPRIEPLHRFANRPYTVFGHDYVPATSLRSYRERGLASWYGRKFHAQKTATGEPYDMYAMTAAHPTLPLPSYARVTNLANGKSVIVRVNDRGPFHPGRIIDLSYAAAYRLGIAQRGSGEVEVESILPTAAPPQLGVPLPPVAEIEMVPAIALPIGQERGGYVTQLGAFANYANAQEFVGRLANQTGTLGVEPKVRQDSGLYRVYVGPYSTREEASRAADRLRDALGLDSTVRIESPAH